MALYSRRPYGYCQRTERKVRLSRLVEDGEIPGLLVDSEEADRPHPQRRLLRIAPDLPPQRPSAPLDAEHTTIRIGTLSDPATGAALFNPVIVASLGAPVIDIASNLFNPIDRRASAIHPGLPWRNMLPQPDGTVDARNRKQSANLYVGPI